jgi:hypothetical protein
MYLVERGGERTAALGCLGGAHERRLAGDPQPLFAVGLNHQQVTQNGGLASRSVLDPGGRQLGAQRAVVAAVGRAEPGELLGGAVKLLLLLCGQQDV